MNDVISQKALIDLESTTIEEIKDILTDFLIDNVYDKDGDLLIKTKSRIYVKLDDEVKALRIFGFIHFDDSNGEFIEKITKRTDLRNRASSTIKFAKMDRSVMLEYGIPLFGYIDHKHLVKTIQHVDEEMSLFRMTVSLFLEG